MNGEPVITNSDPTVFNIEAAGNGEFVVRLASFSLSMKLNSDISIKIKLPYDDLLWNVEPPVIPRGNVRFSHLPLFSFDSFRYHLCRSNSGVRMEG